MIDSYKRGISGESIIYYKRCFIYIKNQQQKLYYQFTWICRLVCFFFLFTVVVRPFFLYYITQHFSNGNFYISVLLANKYMYNIIGRQHNTVNWWFSIVCRRKLWSAAWMRSLVFASGNLTDYTVPLNLWPKNWICDRKTCTDKKTKKQLPQSPHPWKNMTLTQFSLRTCAA